MPESQHRAFTPEELQRLAEAEAEANRQGSFFRRIEDRGILEELEGARQTLLSFRLQDLVAFPHANPAVGIFLRAREHMQPKTGFRQEDTPRSLAVSYLMMKYASDHALPDAKRVPLQMDAVAAAVLYRSALNTTNKWRIPPRLRAGYDVRVEEEAELLRRRFPATPEEDRRWSINRGGRVVRALVHYYRLVGGSAPATETDEETWLLFSVFGFVEDYFRLARRYNPPGYTTDSMAEGSRLAPVKGERESDTQRLRRQDDLLRRERERRNRRIFGFLRDTYPNRLLLETALRHLFAEEFTRCLRGN